MENASVVVNCAEDAAVKTALFVSVAGSENSEVDNEDIKRVRATVVGARVVKLWVVCLHSE